MWTRFFQLGAVCVAAAIGGLMPPGVAQAQPDSSDCAAYAGSSAWCEPGVPDYDCAEIPIDLRPVTVLSIENDPFRLDADNDGEGCELPVVRDENGEDRDDNGNGNGNGEDRDENGDERNGNGDDRDDADQLADDGTLPETGSAPLLLGGIGAGALAAGLLLFLTGRRRGTRFLRP